MSEDRLDRRTFLRYGGAAATTVTLAGCQSGDGGDGDDGDGGDGSDGSDGNDGGDGGDGTDGEDSDTGEFPVRITQGNMPSGLDPHDHRETPTDVVMLHAYEGVLTRNVEGQVQTNLATEFERVAEGHVRFTVRDGVQFHNGDDLTPGDVAHSINRIVQEDVGFASPQRDQLAGVTEASVAETAARSTSSPTASTRSVLRVRDLLRRDATVLGRGPRQGGHRPGDERDRSVPAGQLHRGRAGRPGPQRGLLGRPGRGLTGHVRRRRRVEHARQRLLNEESDVVVNVPPQEVSRVRNSEVARVEAAPSTRVIYNAMRYDVEPFDDQGFRQAMNYAIDLESIVQNVLGGFGAQTGQPTLEGFVGHNPDVDPYPFDPDRAEQLVEESGYAGAEIELHTPVGRYLKDLESAQAVAGYVDDLSNVSASVNQRDFGSLVDELLTGNIEDKPSWYLIGWGEATFDGGLVITALLTTDGALSSYSDDEIDQTMEQAGNQAAEEREETLREVNALLHDRAPWIFLNRQFSVYGASERIDWGARSDERIDAYEMSPSS